MGTPERTHSPRRCALNAVHFPRGLQHGGLVEVDVILYSEMGPKIYCFLLLSSYILVLPPRLAPTNWPLSGCIAEWWSSGHDCLINLKSFIKKSLRNRLKAADNSFPRLFSSPRWGKCGELVKNCRYCSLVQCRLSHVLRISLQTYNTANDQASRAGRWARPSHPADLWLDFQADGLVPCALTLFFCSFRFD
jgi:hypothetical protein